MIFDGFGGFLCLAVSQQSRSLRSHSGGAAAGHEFNLRSMLSTTTPDLFDLVGRGDEYDIPGHVEYDHLAREVPPRSSSPGAVNNFFTPEVLIGERE